MHARFGDFEGFSQLAAHAEGTLCSGPHGELSVRPLGDRGARLQRRVRDVGHRVGLLQLDIGFRETLLDRALALATLTSARRYVLLQVIEQLAAGGLRLRLPLRANHRCGPRGSLGIRGRNAHKIAVVNHGYAGDRLGFVAIHRRERGAERLWSNHAPV